MLSSSPVYSAIRVKVSLQFGSTKPRFLVLKVAHDCAGYPKKRTTRVRLARFIALGANHIEAVFKVLETSCDVPRPRIQNEHARPESADFPKQSLMRASRLAL
jgi:hypothetical protein